MNPFSVSVDLMFAGPMAVDATYTPANGDPLPVRVILSQPDVMTPVYDVPVVSASTALQVRVSEVAALARGDTFTLADGGVLTVSAKPKRDATRLIWVASAVED
ncbi:head-tail joining protein [Oleispirillum naphthae]|uniref:head-tail joining protein n=1 Tax=Oleispirillum naphthae TaxID=2838853 RepID=UPI0030825224